MSQKCHSVDQITSKLRSADVELSPGKKIPEVFQQLEITEQTYYRWRPKYGGMQPEMAKELKALQKENSRLKKMVAEQALDMEILSNRKGNLDINLEQLRESAAAILRKHPSFAETDEEEEN